MATIDIKKPHHQPIKKVQERAEQMAHAMTERFELECWWEDDQLCFQRPGVEGRLTIDEDHVHFLAKLNILLTPIKGMIENEVHNYLDNIDEMS